MNIQKIIDNAYISPTGEITYEGKYGDFFTRQLSKEEIQTAIINLASSLIDDASHKAGEPFTLNNYLTGETVHIIYSQYEPFPANEVI
jgi:hypothetical protein